MTSDTPIVQPPPSALRRVLAFPGLAVQRTGLAIGGALARVPFLVPLIITGGAGFARFWRLSSPHKIVPLDETYYAPNSFGYLCHGSDMTFRAGAAHTCAGLDPTFAVHPPVGKLLTAIGIKIFGYRPFGWRFAAAAAGTLIVLVVYGIGRRLWPDKRWPAAAAAILVAVDGLGFVQSRLAMLDIFVTFFILLGVWLLLVDRDKAPGWTGPRWWRLVSGVSFGLAIASKWAAIPLLPVIAAVAFAWEVLRIHDARAKPAAPPDAEALEREEFWGADPERRSRLHSLANYVWSSPRRLWRYLRSILTQRRSSRTFQALAIVVTLLVLPVGVYLASYTPWFLSTKRYIPPRCNDVVQVGGTSVSRPKAGLALWWCDQREIFDYHRNLKATDDKGKPIHPYMSKAWSWSWISRPASHYFESYCIPGRTPTPCRPGGQVRDEEILGLPNPAIWWMGFFVALPVCFYLVVAKRDDVAALLVVLFAPLVLPWLVYSRPIFMFYMTPAAPLLALMVTHVMQSWRLRWGAVGFVAIAIAMFGYFYPVLAAYPLPQGGAFGWESRIWYGHALKGDCTSDKIKLFCWI